MLLLLMTMIMTLETMMKTTMMHTLYGQSVENDVCRKLTSIENIKRFVHQHKRYVERTTVCRILQ